MKWLEKNGIEHKGALVFPFPYGLKEFNEEPNWVSGMYQGQILSCFARAYYLSKEEKYLDFCEKVWKSFDLKLGEKYGFKYEDKYGLWYEEAPKLPATHILNGFIFAMWGIYDYNSVLSKPDLSETWDRCIQTVLNTLGQYDMGYWSSYDLSGTITSYYYQKVHVILMTTLFDQTGIDTFHHYAKKWAAQMDSRYFIMRKKIYTVKQNILRGKLGLAIRNKIKGIT
jgi:heparosan-N-sulfate-glucuronate 5-epimerase